MFPEPRSVQKNVDQAGVITVDPRFRLVLSRLVSSRLDSDQVFYQLEISPCKLITQTPPGEKESALSKAVAQLLGSSSEVG